MRARLLWRALRARHRDERVELAVIRAAIRPDSVVADVGANRGSYLYWLARWAPRGRVVAFEPQDELAAYLEAMKARLGLDNVTVENVGVSDRAGRRDLFVPGGAVTPGASFSRRVAEREECARRQKNVVTLDDYFDGGRPPDIVKIDVEGHEREVLEGATGIIERSSPLIVVECENRHLERGSVEDVLRFVRALGYDGRFVRRGRLVPIERFDAAVHQRQTSGRYFADKDYCNNFVFRKS